MIIQKHLEQNPLCAQCNAPVQHSISSYDPALQVLDIQVTCHNQTERKVIDYVTMNANPKLALTFFKSAIAD